MGPLGVFSLFSPSLLSYDRYSSALFVTDVTHLLKRISRGDAKAADDLYPVVYDHLHALAASQLNRERGGHTLQPTALLHEAYLRLAQVRDLDWTSRGHFYAMAAKIMRRILISHARAKYAGKRGGKQARVDLEDATGSVWSQPEPLLVALDEALARLEVESPRAYRLVELKFFAGLDFEEAARAMDVSSRTLKRDWALAKAWLYRELGGTALPPPSGSGKE